MQNDQTINLGNILLSLSDALDLFTPELNSHQLRTAFIAWELAKAGGLSQETTETIFAAALLHDVGALSPEEKLALHKFELGNIEAHCVLGHSLFSDSPLLARSGAVVRNHHRPITAWEHPVGEFPVLESQILHLSDLLERLIDRDAYILRQSTDLTDRIVSLAGSELHPAVVGYFQEAAAREEFWLDIVNPRLYSLLLVRGPFRLREIGMREVTEITSLLSHVIDFRSHFTATHTSGVATSACEIGRLCGLTESELVTMRIAGNIHDLGKLAVPNSILEKPDRLTAEEFAVMRQHTYHTFTVVNSVKGLEEAAQWGAFHHEKLDGSGYPFHLKADRLTMGARILAVADIFTACAEDRPYRPGMDRGKVLSILQGQAAEGKIEGRVVEALEAGYDEVLALTKSSQEQAHRYYLSKLEPYCEGSRDPACDKL